MSETTIATVFIIVALGLVVLASNAAQVLFRKETKGWKAIGLCMVIGYSLAIAAGFILGVIKGLS